MNEGFPQNVPKDDLEIPEGPGEIEVPEESEVTESTRRELLDKLSGLVKELEDTNKTPE